MNIAYLAPSLSRAIGGVFEAERELARSLQAIPETGVSVYGLMDHELKRDMHLWQGIEVHAFPHKGPAAFGYSTALRNAFLQAPADIAHLHSIWMYPSLLIQQWARKLGKPYVTSVHGMLDPWAIAQSRWRKMLAAALYERQALQRASCVHVLNVAELQAVRDFGLSGPACVIPNGVSLPDLRATQAAYNTRRTKIGTKKTLLYLGRLHPKKNLMNLLQAFSCVSDSHNEWELVIGGWPQEHYERQLKQHAKNLGISDRVVFPGPLYGSAKESALATAEAFVLASHSEGMPMAVLEAWAFEKPVLMTRMCNLNEGFSAGAALEIGAEAQAIAGGLEKIFSAPDARLSELGRAGRALVSRKYSWGQIGLRMREVYAWLLTGGAKPDDVDL